jgi:hypothetical protein
MVALRTVGEEGFGGLGLGAKAVPHLVPDSEGNCLRAVPYRMVKVFASDLSQAMSRFNG